MIKKYNIKYLFFIACLFMTKPVYAMPLIMDKGCKEVLDPEVITFLQQIFNVFKYLAPVLVLVFTTMDFVKAADSQDKEALKKNAKIALKRVLLALTIFILPDVLGYFLKLLGYSDICGIK